MKRNIRPLERLLSDWRSNAFSSRRASLHQFVLGKRCPFAVRFDLNSPSLLTVAATVLRADGKQKVACELFSLPLYLAGQLPRLLDDLRT